MTGEQDTMIDQRRLPSSVISIHYDAFYTDIYQFIFPNTLHDIFYPQITQIDADYKNR